MYKLFSQVFSLNIQNTMVLSLISQDETNTSVLTIYEEGSNKSNIMANISGNALYYDNISIPGNQMYITFQDNEIGPEKKLHLKIHKSLYNKLSYN